MHQMWVPFPCSACTPKDRESWENSSLPLLPEEAVCGHGSAEYTDESSVLHSFGFNLARNVYQLSEKNCTFAYPTHQKLLERGRLQ